MTFPRALILLAAPVLLLAACATPADPGEGGDVVPGGPSGGPGAIAAPGEVTGQATILQKDGEEAQFCFAVAESYPPQCSGPVVVGWEWPEDGMYESANGVTWGSYAVTGTWDGESLTPTQPPIPLALYDPIKTDPDPRTDPANAGDNSEELLARVQDDLVAWDDVTVLMSHVENGYAWTTVYYDDGTLQAYLDELYGPDVVVVQSAFRDVAAS